MYWNTGTYKFLDSSVLHPCQSQAVKQLPKSKQLRHERCRSLAVSTGAGGQVWCGHHPSLLLPRSSLLPKRHHRPAWLSTCWRKQHARLSTWGKQNATPLNASANEKGCLHVPVNNDPGCLHVRAYNDPGCLRVRMNNDPGCLHVRETMIHSAYTQVQRTNQFFYM